MSFLRYENYKDSGVVWIGAVPEHWETWKVTHAFRTIGSGTTPKSDNLDYYEEGAVPWLNTGDLNDGDLLSCERCVTELAIREHSSLKLYPEGSIVVAMYGATIGKLGALKFPATVNQACCVFANALTINPSFLFYWLFAFRQQIISMATGGGQPNISQDILRSLRISCPDKSEQLNITGFLDRETTKINTLMIEYQRLIELLKEKRLTVISHVVTKGLNPKAAMKPSGIEWFGDVPAHWKINKLSRLSFMQEGPGLRTWQFTNEGTRVICVTNITEAGIDFLRLEKFISNQEYKDSYEHFTVNNGDILLSSSGNSWGKVAIYDGTEKVILNTSTIRLNETPTKPLLRNYLFRLLESIGIREQLGLAMTGSCQPNFGPTHLKEVLIAIPSPDEQIEILNFLDYEMNKIHILVAEATKAIMALEERRAALISAAVTGKIDVRSLVKDQKEAA